MEDVLDVVVFLEFLEEFVEVDAVLGGEMFHLAVGEAVETCGHEFETLVLDVLLDVVEGGVFAVDVDDFLGVAVLVLEFVNEDLFRAKVDQFEFEFLDVDVGAVLDLEDAFVVEHEGYAAGGAEAAAELVEVAADVGHGAVGVVGSGLHEDGHAVGAVALVHHFLVVGLVLVGGLLDGAFDIFLRHVLTAGCLQQGAEARVAGHVGSAVLDGDGDFLADLGEGLGHVAPTLELSLLAEFKCSSHGPDYFWFSMREIYFWMS